MEKGRKSMRSSALLAFAMVLAAACARTPAGGQPEAPPPQDTPAPTRAPADLHAALPMPPGPLAPAEARVDGPGLRGVTLSDAAECETCHADAAAQWRTSAHSFASFINPIYRAAVDRFRDEVGEEKSRFCGACHDIALLVDGAMDRPVDPADPRAHGGVSCRVCHGIVEARADGNGSYVLAAAPIPPPTPGDAQSLALHKARAVPQPLRTAALCSSCHRAFLGPPTGNAHHLIGQDDVTPWQQSIYAGSRVHMLDEDIPARDCRGCHMPREKATRGDAATKKDGTIASHRFLGAHTWLAAMRGDAEGLAQARAMLEGAASIDVAALVHEDGQRALPADGAPVRAGERVVLDVVVRNVRAGHRFPGGTLDAQDAWIVVEVRDAAGNRVAEAGTEHEATGADPTAHRLRALQVDDDGKPQLERQTHRFRTAVYSHAVPARDVAVAEYGLEIPATLPASAFPLSVTAELLHRTRSLEVQRTACAAAKSPRGKAFQAAGAPFDPCAPQPITKIAQASIWIGPGASAHPAEGAERPVWKRLYEHGLGMMRAVQERRDEALPSLQKALALLEGSGDARAKAMVMAALGSLAGRQGRVDEAMMWLDRASPLAPDHPALAYLRGDALSNVWRFAQAEAPLATAVARAPGDDAAWVMLATARGSAGDPAGALLAAREGLSVQPRDADLLRIQALSLGALGADEAETEAARKAWQAFRPADVIPSLKGKCSAKVPGCALERNPVHVHAMRVVAR
jgi:tetratricopeptide (TPR) repeat protein